MSRFQILSACVGGAAALLVATAGWADAILTYQAGDEQLVLESRGDDLRMGSPANPEGYMLLKDGAVYMVSDGPDGPMVFDLAAMMGSMAAMMPQGLPGAAAESETAPTASIERTGRYETHAGLKGEIVTLTSEAGRNEVVLSDDADVRAAFAAFRRLSESLASSMPPGFGAPPVPMPDVDLDRALASTGVLRVDDALVLTAIERTAPAAERLALPAAPITNPMEAIGGFR